MQREKTFGAIFQCVCNLTPGITDILFFFYFFSMGLNAWQIM